MPLVTVQDLLDFLGEPTAGGNAVAETILAGVEAWLLEECGRTRAPFADAQTGRVERLRGTGSEVVHVDYPIATVTTVVLGFDSAAPDETLNPASKTVLIWQAGDRHLVRVDGGRFGGFGWPAYVHITYDTQAELPQDAALAIMRVAAAVYRQRGSEDERQSSIGGQQIVLAQVANEDPVWQAAVGKYRRAPV